MHLYLHILRWIRAMLNDEMRRVNLLCLALKLVVIDRALWFERFNRNNTCAHATPAKQITWISNFLAGWSLGFLTAAAHSSLPNFFKL